MSRWIHIIAPTCPMQIGKRPHDASMLISDLNHQLKSTNLLVESLLFELTHFQQPIATNKTIELSKFNYDDVGIGLSDEAKLVINPHKLPLGYSPMIGLDELYPPVGGGCLKYQEELMQDMTQRKKGVCDEVLGSTNCAVLVNHTT
ncbi:hypothetical protein HYC85_010036 [Camellia sinensis]|uniref:Uncharacterized protein n=1 Tax=Camellia sinensis TaxID=4442 RepID=A0A7J7HGS1_CAMSI|nr:hypothetical protein HYC85_010036 [Camellia sinensis]